MKHVLPLAFILGWSGAAHAQGRPDTSQLTCASARALVERAGAIVLNTGRFTYDRFVNHRGFCTRTESIEPAFVPSRDNQACYIGSICVEKSMDTDP